MNKAYEKSEKKIARIKKEPSFIGKIGKDKLSIYNNP